MGVTSVSQEMLIAKGIPEAFLVALAIHIFNETKVDWRKYLVMSLAFLMMPYLLRKLPISSGVNTVLSLFGLIFVFQVLYHSGLQKIVRAMISPIIILILISIAEVLNLVFLAIFYGFEQANALCLTPNGWEQCLYTLPSTVFLALLLLLASQVMKLYKKRTKKDGKGNEEVGE